MQLSPEGVEDLRAQVHISRLRAASTRLRAWSFLLGFLGVCAILLLGVGANPVVAIVAMGLLTASLALSLSLPSGGQVEGQGTTAGITPWIPPLIAGVVAQLWFSSGTVLAGWDAVPPEGTGWIGRLFDPWIWSGSNLGGPNVEQIQLPWATVELTVEAMGGTAGEAQRLWFTILFVGCSVAAFRLLTHLGLAQLPAAIGAIIFVLNPAMMLGVSSPVYLTTMLLLVLLPSLALEGATARRSLFLSGVLIGACGPLLGYTYSNPPLAGVDLGALAMAIPVASLVGGRVALMRSIKVVAFGTLLLALLSAYWILPQIVALESFSKSSYTPLAAWVWEETRATLANAFTLNTNWAWPSRPYFPYATIYGTALMRFAGYFLPATAFAAVPLFALRPAERKASVGRLVSLAAFVSIVILYLSTGTNPPGAYVFNVLYALPLGWLLREPFRFLLIGSLTYAVLIAAVVQWVSDRIAVRHVRARFAGWGRLLPAVGLTLGVVLLVLPAFPEVTGAVIPRQPAGGIRLLAPHRVHFPGYWEEMASYLNSPMAPPGGLIALPADGPSDMVEYQWGYLGVDAFMFQLFKRNVLDPNAQNYYAASPSLIGAVHSLSQSLDLGQWNQTQLLANALGVHLVLVRGDLNPSSAYNLISGQRLIQSLNRDPYAHLLDIAGPLRVYSLQLIDDHDADTEYATVNSAQPNLADLAVLPKGFSLISLPPQAGIPSLKEGTALEAWHLRGSLLTLTMQEMPGQRYRLYWLDGRSTVPLTNLPNDLKIDSSAGPDGITLVRLHYSLPDNGKDLITDGGFSAGPWDPSPGDCNDGGEPKSPTFLGLRAVVSPSSGPHGSPALDLSAHHDSACESKPLAWPGGPLLINLWARSVAGAAPRICLLQSRFGECAAGTTMSASASWQQYQFLVSPRAGTTRLSLFLYADATASGRTEIQYSQVTVDSGVSASGRPLLVGMPDHPGGMQRFLTLTPDAFSSSWSADGGAKHVLVDGLRSGWLGSRRVKAVRFSGARLDEAGWIASLVTAVLALFALCIVLLRSITRRWRAAGGTKGP